MASLEVSMIVKNGEPVLARCLRSLRALSCQIVIGDTGSSDRSVEIARDFGARVVNLPWEDDFARARNAVLASGGCDWVLILDADEMLDERAAAEIAPLLADDSMLGYDVRIWNYVPTLTNRILNSPALPNPQRLAEARPHAAYVEHVNVRLFRRHPEIFFEGRVHESVADRMKRLGMPVGKADFIVHHLGTAEDSAAEHARKMQFYRELGEKKLLETPDDYRALWELGLAELEQFRNPRRALHYLSRAIAIHPGAPLFWTYAAICHLRMGEREQAIQRLEQARRLGARDAVFFETRGDAHYAAENFAEAQGDFEAAIAAGSRSAVVASKLGVCQVRQGAAAAGLERIQKAIEREPDFGELRDILVAAALFAGDWRLASEAAEERLAVGAKAPERFLLATQIRIKLGDLRRARELAEAGCEHFPDSQELLSLREELRRVTPS